MNLSEYDTHYFTYIPADSEWQESITKVSESIEILGGKCFSYRISSSTGEYKCEYRSKLLNEDKILLYLSSLKNCRVFK